MKKSYQRCLFQGFTVIELLLVITIIGLLAVLVVSALRSSRTVLNRAKCAGQLRQIAAASHQYAQDHDGYLPGPVSGHQKIYITKTGMSNLAFHFAPYLGVTPPGDATYKVVEAFICPGWLEWRGMLPSSADNPFTYVANITDLRPFGYKASGVTAPEPPKKMITIAELSKTLMLWDADSKGLPAYKNSPNVPSKPIHNEKRNYLFFDGHVEFGISGSTGVK